MSALDAHVRLTQAGFSVDAALALEKPGILSLYGPSGSGKTTLLRALAGLEPRASGHIRVGGRVWQDASRRLPPHRRHVGLVFQDVRLFPHLDVRGNLLSGPRFRGDPAELGSFSEICALLNLEGLLDRPVFQISGGERQRVAIGRCLLARPELLLLDEPLSAVDTAHRAEILPYLVRLHAELDLPVVHVSHDWHEVLQLADQVAVLEQGRIRLQGPPQSVNARLIGGPRCSLNLLSGQVRSYDHREELLTVVLGELELHIPGASVRPGAQVRVLVDLSEIALSRQPPDESSFLNILPATVQGQQESGPGTVRIDLELAGQSISALITRRSASRLVLQPGESVFVLIKSAAVQVVS